jgi:hypothetical protein
VNSEIVDHAARLLDVQPTRTLSARTLHRRVAAALGGVIGYAEFLHALRSRPDRFAVSADRPPLLEAWAESELARYHDALDGSGLAIGAAVSLTEPTAGTGGIAKPGDPLLDTLRDARAAVADLIRGSVGEEPDAWGDALVGLEQLRHACPPP